MRAITKGLPRQPKKDGHFAAMPYDKVPAFLRRLPERETFSRLALQFAIFTAARSGEVREAKWSEIDFATKLWTVPKERMKANREHVVPLNDGALRVLRRCLKLRGGADLPGVSAKIPLVRHDPFQAAHGNARTLHAPRFSIVVSGLGQ
nr:tyrosine-type recombinase/integrase [uncultured Novosphingobium sp.]